MIHYQQELNRIGLDILKGAQKILFKSHSTYVLFCVKVVDPQRHREKRKNLNSK